MKLDQETTRADLEPAAAVANAALDQPAVPDWLGYIAEPRHTWPILLIFGVALYLVNLGGYPLYTKGEPREAVTVFAGPPDTATGSAHTRYWVSGTGTLRRFEALVDGSTTWTRVDLAPGQAPSIPHIPGMP